MAHWVSDWQKERERGGGIKKERKREKIKLLDKYIDHDIDKEREGEKESEAVILIGLFLCVILLCDFD